MGNQSEFASYLNERQSMSTVDLPLPEEGNEEMAVDLPPAFAQQILAESASNMVSDNRNGRAATTTANNVLQMAAARNFDELGAVESRATSGVLGTPIAGPTTQVGP